MIRLVVKTRTATKDDVARELRARLKKALDEKGVELPSFTTLLVGGLDGTAVRGSPDQKKPHKPSPASYGSPHP